MAETISTSPGTSRRRWPLIVGLTLLGLLLLLVVTYFVATSSAFFKGVILPRVGKAMNATITVSEAQLSPFSSVILRDLKVVTTEPLLTAQEVRARYSLSDIIRGNIHVDELALINPVISLHVKADGSSNLDPVIRSQEKDVSPKDESSKTPQVQIGHILIKDGTVLVTSGLPDGKEQRLEVASLNFDLRDLKNSGTAKLALSANASMKRPGLSPTNANDRLDVALQSEFQVSLSEKLLPTTMDGKAALDVNEAQGSFQDFTQFKARMVASVTPQEVKELSLKFLRGSTNLGALQISGPLNLATRVGSLDVQLNGIDRQVLNIAGAVGGIDFRQTSLSSSNHVDLAANGQIHVVGKFLASQFSAQRMDQTTPTVDLSALYDVTANPSNKTAVARTFSLLGTQNGQPLLQGSLTRPMALNWGETKNAVEESSFQLSVTNLNVADWRAFAGTNITSGRVQLQMALQAQGAGQQLKLTVQGGIADFSADFGSNQVRQANLQWSTRAQVSEFKVVNVEELALNLRQQQQDVASMTATGLYQVVTREATLSTQLKASLPGVARVAAMPNFNASAGELTFDGIITQKNLTPRNTNNPTLNQTVAGAMKLASFTGHFGESAFQDYGATLSMDLQADPQVLHIRKLDGALTQQSRPGGSFNLSGTYHLQKKAAELALKLNGLNENGLRSFVEPALKDKRLVSISINGTSDVSYQPDGTSKIVANMEVTNLVAQTVAATEPATPLGARLEVDTSMDATRIKIRQARLSLSPTERAKNQVQLEGDLQRGTNTTSGTLKLTADSLDLTPYYDLLSGQTTNAPQAASPASPESKPAPAGPGNQEPEPIQLPLDKFTMEVAIGEIYLREMHIHQLKGTARFEGNKVNVSPMDMELNGAPVNLRALVNVGVKGYEYDLTFNALHVPVKPLADSFADEQKGKYDGNLIAKVQVRGAGVTGVNLKKSLTGQVGLTLTNANIQIVGDRMRKMILPVATVLRMPEIAQSPLNWLDIQSSMGNGQIDLKTFHVTSEAFEANAVGTVTIADVLTNSPINQIPVQLSLRRSLAQKANLLPANTPENAKYAALPAFVRLGGTVGNPKVDLKEGVIAGLLAGSLSDLVGGDAGKVLKNVGGFLTPGATGGSTNNAPAGGLIPAVGGFLFPKKNETAPAVTNRPATSTATNATPAPRGRNRNRTPETNRVNLLDLIPGR